MIVAAFLASPVIGYRWWRWAGCAGGSCSCCNYNYCSPTVVGTASSKSECASSYSQCSACSGYSGSCMYTATSTASNSDCGDMDPEMCKAWGPMAGAVVALGAAYIIVVVVCLFWPL